jgi:hypothetical protein
VIESFKLEKHRDLSHDYENSISSFL